MAENIDLAIIAESARCGDYRRDVDHSASSLYTRNDHWIPRKNDLLENYFPFRSETVVEQFRKFGLFPDIEAPVFSEESGDKNGAINLAMTSNYGDIYYTTDGSDPRVQISSNVSGSAQVYNNEILLNSEVTVKARAKSGNEWSPITEGIFTFNGTTGLEDLAAETLSHKITKTHSALPPPLNTSCQLMEKLFWNLFPSTAKYGKKFF